MTPAIQKRIRDLAKVDAQLGLHSRDVIKIIGEAELAEYEKAYEKEVKNANTR